MAYEDAIWRTIVVNGGNVTNTEVIVDISKVADGVGRRVQRGQSRGYLGRETPIEKRVVSIGPLPPYISAMLAGTATKSHHIPVEQGSEAGKDIAFGLISGYA